VNGSLILPQLKQLEKKIQVSFWYPHCSYFAFMEIHLQPRTNSKLSRITLTTRIQLYLGWQKNIISSANCKSFTSAPLFPTMIPYRIPVLDTNKTCYKLYGYPSNHSCRHPNTINKDSRSGPTRHLDWILAHLIMSLEILLISL